MSADGLVNINYLKQQQKLKVAARKMILRRWKISCDYDDLKLELT